MPVRLSILLPDVCQALVRMSPQEPDLPHSPTISQSPIQPSPEGQGRRSPSVPEEGGASYYTYWFPPEVEGRRQMARAALLRLHPAEEGCRAVAGAVAEAADAACEEGDGDVGAGGQSLVDEHVDPAFPKHESRRGVHRVGCLSRPSAIRGLHPREASGESRMLALGQKT